LTDAFSVGVLQQIVRVFETNLPRPAGMPMRSNAVFAPTKNCGDRELNFDIGVNFFF
jgi:hypothetical protein